MSFNRFKILIFYTCFFVSIYWMLWLFDPQLGYIYDLFTQQKTIETREELESQFNSFEMVDYDQLPDQKKQDLVSKEDKTCYSIQKSALYKKRRFLKINWFDRYKYLVADFRVLDFLSGSPFLANSFGFPHLDKTQYLLIDKRILLKMLSLKKKLEEKGYRGDQFSINSSFRTPIYNEIVGGKICSRHQFGDAIDIQIYDINGDGSADAKDAILVFDLLDKEIIKNSGGLGKYKSDANVLHFDTRGKRARWFY